LTLITEPHNAFQVKKCKKKYVKILTDLESHFVTFNSLFVKPSISDTEYSVYVRSTCKQIVQKQHNSFHTAELLLTDITAVNNGQI